ncbi:MAG TPA: ATP-binding protein [Tepidisphaeraceae bacterium]|jgi:signal transduction histidine kinase
MTRRIAIAILLSVWAAILVAGSATYLFARHLLLDQLDNSIKYAIVASNPPISAQPTGNSDQMILGTDSSGRTYRRPLGREAADNLKWKTGNFIADGRLRQVTFWVMGESQTPVSEIHGQADAEDFHTTMRSLALAISGCGLAAGIAAALVSARLARLALRPLNTTVEVIGTIDESNLDRRIEAADLPPELRPMADRLNEMLERLGNAFEERRRFLADASHELRTPVAAMITTMEVALRRPRPAAELAETLDICLSEARHMRQLVQALLRQVRAEGSASTDELLDVDAGEMLNQCAELAGSLAAEKNINLVRHVNGKIPVHAELGRLRSVVLNLVSNAIDYNTPGGTVELSAESNGHGTEIVIKDNGPGIAPEHLPHLFEPFYRATRARESDGHLGLGLFLVESHVKAMGGECRVESALGAGTTFRVRLPSTSLPSPGNGGLSK